MNSPETPEFRLRTSVVLLHNDKILTFLAVDPHDGRPFYFLPGGAIEKNETAPDAAIRETLEETGFQVSLNTQANVDREYLFYWNGIYYLSHTIFYRGYLANPFQVPKPVNDAPYHKGVFWIDREKAIETFAYSKDVQEAVMELLLV